MRQSEYKYFAFISYNSKDTEWGKRVQRKLEHYRMPATLCSERGVICNILFPVFSQSYFPAYFISGFFLGRPLLVSFLSIVCLFSIL